MIDCKKIRIIYMGTPDMSAQLLEHLIINGYNIVGVIAQPDQKVGRKQELEEVPTKVIAKMNNIPVFQPIKIKYDYSFVADLNPDLILCFAYGQIIPEIVLKMPKYGALNYHGSILPKYRGAAPIQYALINNDTESGVCLMEMVKQMDAGRVFQLEKFPLTSDDNFDTVANKVVMASKTLTDHYLQAYVNGELVGVPQDESKVTFSPSIKSEEEKINLEYSVEKVLGLIRALSPNIGAYVIYKEQVLKIFEAQLVDHSDKYEVGTIIKADKMGLHIQFLHGVVSVLTLQKAGKKKIGYRDFVNGEKDLLITKVF